MIKTNLLQELEAYRDKAEAIKELNDVSALKESLRRELRFSIMKAKI